MTDYDVQSDFQHAEDRTRLCGRYLVVRLLVNLWSNE